MSDKPAFPIPGMDMQYPGLTKRELFAAMILQGMASNSSHTAAPYEAFAKGAVMGADALIKALEVGGE